MEDSPQGDVRRIVAATPRAHHDPIPGGDLPIRNDVPRVPPAPGRALSRRSAGGFAALALVLVLPMIAPVRPLGAESIRGERSSADSAEAVRDNRGFRVRVVPPEMRYRDWFALPIGSYSSETGLGLGGQILRTWRGPGGADADFPATLTLRGLQTLKGQQSLEATLTIYRAERAWRWRTRGSWADLRRRFWGLGSTSPESAEEPYRPEELQLFTELSRRVTRHLRLGPRLEYAAVRYREVLPTGELQALGPERQTDGGIAGAGLVADFDTRDRDSAPKRGVRIQGLLLQFFDGAGGEYAFFNTNLDARAYHPLWSGCVLAGQAFFYEVTRGAPLWRYAQLGGRGHSRAYPRGRFTDRALGAGQLELRHDLAWRLGFVLFGGAGTVAADADVLTLRHLHASYGAGLRFRLAGEENARGRLDVAFGDDGNHQIYFGLDEAF